MENSVGNGGRSTKELGIMSSSELESLPNELIAKLIAMIDDASDPLYSIRLRLADTCHRIRLSVVNCVQGKESRLLRIERKLTGIGRQQKHMVLINGTEVPDTDCAVCLIKSIIILLRPNRLHLSIDLLCSTFQRGGWDGTDVEKCVVATMTEYDVSLEHLKLSNTDGISLPFLTLLRANAATLTKLTVHVFPLVPHFTRDVNDQLKTAILGCGNLEVLWTTGVWRNTISFQEWQHSLAEVDQLRQLRALRFANSELCGCQHGWLYTSSSLTIKQLCCRDNLDGHELQVSLHGGAVPNVSEVCCVESCAASAWSTILEWREKLPNCSRLQCYVNNTTLTDMSDEAIEAFCQELIAVMQRGGEQSLTLVAYGVNIEMRRFVRAEEGASVTLELCEERPRCVFADVRVQGEYFPRLF